VKAGRHIGVGQKPPQHRIAPPPYAPHGAPFAGVHVPLLQVWQKGQLMALQTQLAPLQSGAMPPQILHVGPQWVASLATQAPLQQSCPLPQLVAEQTQVPPLQSRVVPPQVVVQVPQLLVSVCVLVHWPPQTSGVPLGHSQTQVVGFSCVPPVQVVAGHWQTPS
jgi:hypothetical protein